MFITFVSYLYLATINEHSLKTHKRWNTGILEYPYGLALVVGNPHHSTYSIFPCPNGQAGIIPCYYIKIAFYTVIININKL